MAFVLCGSFMSNPHARDYLQSYPSENSWFNNWIVTYSLYFRALQIVGWIDLRISQYTGAKQFHICSKFARSSAHKHSSAVIQIVSTLAFKLYTSNTCVRLALHFRWALQRFWNRKFLNVTLPPIRVESSIVLKKLLSSGKIWLIKCVGILSKCQQRERKFRNMWVGKFGSNRCSIEKVKLFQLVKTLLSQSHLIPLPIYVSPVYWQFDHSLRLYPLPDLLVIADKYDPFTVKESDCTVINPVSVTLYLLKL